MNFKMVKNGLLRFWALLLTICLLIASTAFAAESTATTASTSADKVTNAGYFAKGSSYNYKYPELAYWYMPMSPTVFPGMPMDSYGNQNVYNLMSKNPMVAGEGKGFNLDAFVYSKLGESVIKSMYPFILYANEMDPGLLKYWELKGLKKELYDAATPTKKWSIFTPLSMKDAKNKGKLYPVVFIWHGGNTPINLAETYGMVELGSKEGFISVLPEANNNQDGPQEFDRILKIIAGKYPVDLTRVYCFGYSGGQDSVYRTALMYTNKIAAISPNQSGITGGVYQNSMEGSLLGDNVSPKDAFAPISKYKMPIIGVYGSYDRKQIPVTDSDNPEQLIQSVNLWLSANACTAKPQSLDTVKKLLNSSSNEVKKIVGFDFDSTLIGEAEGTRWLTGDFVNAEGVTMLRNVYVEKLPHMCTPHTCEVAWDFIKHFSRNPKTGMSVYTK